jgi:hypothetical protein
MLLSTIKSAKLLEHHRERPYLEKFQTHGVPLEMALLTICQSSLVVFSALNLGLHPSCLWLRQTDFITKY